MSRIYRFIQGTEDWQNHRILHRNASETAAAMGISPWMSRYQLWEVKTGRRASETTYPMQRGIELEPRARAAYEAATGNLVEAVVMVDGDYSCSLDGLSFDGHLVLEIKCPLHGRESETWRQAAEGRIEPHYLVQVQHQLMVSQAKDADFFVFDGKKGVIVNVKADTEMQAKICQAWDSFWELIVKDMPPPLTHLDTVLRDDPEWERAAQSFTTRKEACEEAAKALETAKDRLVALTKHTSERGCGVSVSRFWRGPKATKEEVRVTVLKQGEERC